MDLPSGERAAIHEHQARGRCGRFFHGRRLDLDPFAGTWRACAVNRREAPPDDRPGASDPGAVPLTFVARVQKRFFYGWIIVAAGFCAQMITSISMQGLAIYAQPLRQEFGWTAAQMSLGRSVQTVDTLLGPLGGALVDRFGAKRLMVAGTILYCAAFALFGTMESLVGFYVACLSMGLANSLIGLLTVSQLINSWFSARRSTAMGLAVAGFAVAGFVALPLIVLAESHVGWRLTAIGTGFAILGLGLPVMLLVRSHPEALGLRPDGGPVPVAGVHAARPSGAEGLSLRQALATHAFWFVTAAMAFSNFHQAALLVHLFPYLEGVSGRAVATLFLAEVNVFNLAGRIFGGMLGDLAPKRVLLGTNVVAAAVALIILAASPSVVAIAIFAAIFGFAWGTRTAVSSALIGEYFGRRSYGKIAGIVQTFAAIVTIISPVAVGLMLDASVAYGQVFIALAVLTALSGLFFFLARKPQPKGAA
ncbi:MFS transporter [Chelatococcus asaccharovorans]|uniref:Sugar phosphate permease n=1 Tax=Chelatococcus asaccharovorans TaxID=28210 RepID=A0A2V3UDY0_9HYPH|nr:MFS transporter [Chelatococcus asaccharovorans]MBS7706958.1 MFS transporter [Chelatococcus asaccharovorans]PXW63137.1 sugar phosphate permease [Chelatococcus asaccharovorans]